MKLARRAFVTETVVAVVALCALTAACAAPPGDEADTQEADAPQPIVVEPPSVGPRPGEAAAVTSVGVLSIVAGDSGLPVPGARVAFRRANTPLGLTELDLAADLVAEIGRGGLLLTANEQGRVDVPAFEHFAEIAARGDGRSGGDSFRRGDGPEWTLLVYPESSLAVRVTDDSGATRSGVAVVLAATGFAETRHALAHAVTRADGVAVFPSLRPAEHAWLRRDPHVGFPVPGDSGPWIGVDPASPSQTPIELTLPPTGTLRVEICDPSGTVVSDGPYQVGLALIPRWDGKPDFGTGDSAEWTRETEGGRADFPALGLGVRVTITAEPTDASRLPATLAAEGPTERGATTVVRVTAGPRRPTLTGRLLADTDGAPVAGRLIVARVLRPGEIWVNLSIGHGSATTAADGTFRLVMPALERDDETSPPPTLQLSDPVATQELGWPRIVTSLPYRPDEAGATFGLGDFRVPVPRLLLAGFVTDEAGAPVPRAAVAVVARGATPAPWVSRTTDATGAFRLVGMARSDDTIEARVKAAAYHHVDGPFRAPLGTADAVIKMQRAGMVRGRLLLPEFGERNRAFWLSYRLTVEARPAGGRSLHTGHVLGDGEFVINGVPPGPADLRVVLGRAQTVARRDDVVVREGFRSADSSDIEIDLRERLRVTRVGLVAGLHETVPTPEIFVREPESSGWERLPSRFHLRQFNVITASERAEILVLADGFRPEFLPADGASHSLRLRSAPMGRVRLHLVAPPTVLPAAPRRLEAALTWIGPLDSDGTDADRPDGGVGPLDVGGMGFRTDRACTSPRLRAGRYRVSLSLEDYVGDVAVRSRPVATFPADFVIELTSSNFDSPHDVGLVPELIPVMPDAESLARALRGDD